MVEHSRLQIQLEEFQKGIRHFSPAIIGKAYGLALSLFAVEVVLLYLFTVRFS